MSRARNIKPGFFTNEDLVELPFETRLLFIGLWTLADREGRLEDRPKRIKMSIFPADSVDMDAALTSLHDSGFIRRYEANGVRCIQVVNFAKHQNPHVREAPSSLPQESESGESTGQAPCRHRASHADSLNPESIYPPNPPAGGFPVDNSTGEEKPASKRPGRNGKAAKQDRVNLATDIAVAKAWRQHLGKDPPAGKSLEECRTMFWQQYRGAH